MPKYKWDGGFEAYRQHDGKQITVIRDLTEDEADIAEVGPMSLVVTEDGTELHVYTHDEIVEDES